MTGIIDIYTVELIQHKTSVITYTFMREQVLTNFDQVNSFDIFHHKIIKALVSGICLYGPYRDLVYKDSVSQLTR